MTTKGKVPSVAGIKAARRALKDHVFIDDGQDAHRLAVFFDAYADKAVAKERASKDCVMYSQEHVIEMLRAAKEEAVVLERIHLTILLDQAPSKGWRDYMRLALRGETGHEDHGRGSAFFGPHDSDCPCRATDKQKECRKSGCGFCQAGSKP